jgi:catechol 2,3-dioxygenase-like lactoylglutathione lyase family enzyme
MLDHLTFTVSDPEKAKAFCDNALAPLGVAVVMQVPAAGAGRANIGYGSGAVPISG